MTARTSRRVAGCIAAASIALMAGELALAYLDRNLLPASQTGWSPSAVFDQLTTMAVPLTGWIIASRRPANRIGWLILMAGAALAVSEFFSAYGLRALVAAPGTLPAGRVAAWLANWTWIIAYVAVAYVFLLFPTGRLRTPRWRPVAWIMGGLSAVAVAGTLVIATSIWSRPDANGSQTPPALTAVLIGMVAAMAIGVVALVVRFARSAGEERLQMKWFAAGAVLVIVTLILVTLLPNVAAAYGWLPNAAFLSLSAAAAVAVLKYRLYDIDIVISKAVQYGALAVFITAVYAALVIGVGTLAGNTHSPVLVAVAAAVVAVAFQPARRRAGRLARQVVYGRRATPYQVLSDFAQRLGVAYASEDVLPQMAQIVASGTGAERVVVWLRVGDELQPAASSDGSPPVDRLPIEGHELPTLPDADLNAPVVNQGELLGAISVTMPKDEPLRPAGAQLVADVASQAGLVLANAGLIEDLRASRQRLVTAQDEARRRLERNIHDGAQQDLVALAIKAQLADVTVDEDPVQAKQIIGEIKTDAAGALENLRALARGIYPPLLADLGLAAALGAQASKSPVPVVIEADGIGRYPQDTEAAVYFCCLEALQNTAKYAHATQARVCLQAQNGSLRFTVSDDGAGYDARHTPMGSGLRNMSDRLAALGGWLEIRSAPGQGSAITGRLPISLSNGNHQRA
jgi:signal transduction histidine kinase